MPMVIEYPVEFAARHGDRVKVNDKLLFEDGATASSDFEQRTEPPQDPYHRLRYRRAFHLAKLKALETSFNRLKGALLGNLGTFHWDAELLGPDPGEAVAALEQIKQLVLDQRAKLAKVETELAEQPQEIERRAAEAYRLRVESEQRAAAAEELGRIESVNI